VRVGGTVVPFIPVVASVHAVVGCHAIVFILLLLVGGVISVA
jgi:hypothetical protein